MSSGRQARVSAAFALTQEEYSIWRRVSKKAPALFGDEAL